MRIVDCEGEKQERKILCLFLYFINQTLDVYDIPIMTLTLVQQKVTLDWDSAISPHDRENSVNLVTLFECILNK